MLSDENNTKATACEFAVQTKQLIKNFDVANQKWKFLFWFKRNIENWVKWNIFWSERKHFKIV